ncbi:NDR1/HIN1-like protein 10 [Phoenix dactylifera]|uniref:NDR1/HIN1-like protein 10 n=1 Tax=Phoenix dactylifera TaxID=42345 RepID=A0A8B7CQQ5_PHODC|nr:NDR1/HIN1-like protein 10 [Phoenix dactylifera]
MKAMGDRPYLSSNRNANGARTLNGSGATANGGSGRPPAFPATKAQQYSATRPLPRPPPRPRRRRRGCCCTCCLWLTLLLIGLIFLAAIAAGVFYVLCRPQRPSFSVESFRLSTFNITSSNLLTSRLDLAVSARNPNRKVVFLYDDVAISAYSDGVVIGQGSFPAFVHGTENTTVLKATVSSSRQSLEPGEAADLTKRKKFPLEIDLETKAGVKIGGFKSKKIGIRVLCDGIEGRVAKGNPAAGATSPANARCQVKLRIKIWNWTF